MLINPCHLLADVGILVDTNRS